MTPESKRNLLENLVKERKGLSLSGLGKKIQMTRQGISYLLHQYNIYDTWKKDREELLEKETSMREAIKGPREAKKKVLRALDSWLKAGIIRKAETEDWPFRKAAEYVAMRETPERNGHSFEKLISFFRAYETAAKNRQRLPLHELGKSINCTASSAGDILSRAKLPALTWNCHKPTEEEVQNRYKKISTLYAMGISLVDIAKFMNLYEPFVRKRMYQKPRIWDNAPQHAKIYGRHMHYHDASEAYQASDLKFGRYQIAELLDIDNLLRVDFLLENRPSIETTIKKILKIVHGKDFDNPYIETVSSDSKVH